MQKYRAWNPDSKQFTYFDFADLDSMQVFWSRHGLAENGVFVYQQYTGLNDRNEKEIYAGDIIRQFGYNEVVEFKRIEDIGSVCYGYDIGDAVNCEVIGNIYENSDLLN